MIIDTLGNADRYLSLHPLFLQAFEYIRKHDLLQLAPGRYPIVGDALFFIIDHAEGRRREQAKLECHRKYIDIQLVLEGEEEMGWKSRSHCTTPVADYNAERDIQFFQDAPASWITTPSGAFCIFFPGDAHAPLVATGKIRKAIFKIAVNMGQ